MKFLFLMLGFIGSLSCKAQLFENDLDAELFPRVKVKRLIISVKDELNSLVATTEIYFKKNGNPNFKIFSLKKSSNFVIPPDTTFYFKKDFYSCENFSKDEFDLIECNRDKQILKYQTPSIVSHYLYGVNKKINRHYIVELSGAGHKSYLLDKFYYNKAGKIHEIRSYEQNFAKKCKAENILPDTCFILTQTYRATYNSKNYLETVKRIKYSNLKKESMLYTIKYFDSGLIKSIVYSSEDNEKIKINISYKR